MLKDGIHGYILKKKNIIKQGQYQSKFNHLDDTSKPKLVLDIGCGSYPIPADVFLDIDISPDLRYKTNNQGEYIIGDCQHLPFKDKIFDFVHCSNVLEHVDDPKLGFEEIKRVGKHGYIECPSGFRENVICRTGAHKWVIINKDQELLYEMPKPRKIFGVQVLPITWIYYLLNKKPMLWKTFEYFLDEPFDLLYVKFRF